MTSSGSVMKHSTLPDFKVERNFHKFSISVKAVTLWVQVSLWSLKKHFLNLDMFSDSKMGKKGVARYKEDTLCICVSTAST